MQSVLQKTTGLGPKPVRPDNLNGRVAIVVGGAFGIGFEVSRALANAGCRVIMVNRKEDQGEDAIATITAESPGASVDWKECDMGNLKQVREVFSALRRDALDRLDFLVLSAGINTNEYGIDADGIERHFGVNYLGQFYVVNQLWPVLRKTSKMSGVPPPRVVFEASEMHRTAPSHVHFASLDEINDSSLGPTELYGRTKLALILLTKYGLAGSVIKENQDNIYALSVHPGAVRLSLATNMIRLDEADGSFFFSLQVNTAMQQQWKDAYPGLTGKLLTWAMLAFGRDVKQGSYSALWALTDPKIEEENMNGFTSTTQTKSERSLPRHQMRSLGALFGTFPIG
ncbi:putative oxidoreductase bli-4, mitochondrial [Madurella mycetomatis]|uniref:Oxidoreductase bli-4, mitochondrial n=1 Tax=Madurella mycetomatis TaxID=100816 RepID=A0A175VPD1_9PEZI|nr:putative oxidoreductase bli-4, mitochondrial [Madurella mycetomatis]